MPWGRARHEGRTTDVEAAKKLLDDGRLGGSARRRHPGEGRRSRGARPVLRCRTTPCARPSAAEFADQMKELGIEVNIKGAKLGRPLSLTSSPRPGRVGLGV